MQVSVSPCHCVLLATPVLAVTAVQPLSGREMHYRMAQNIQSVHFLWIGLPQDFAEIICVKCA